MSLDTRSRLHSNAQIEGMRDHLCVDRFMQSFECACALKAAFDLGIIDTLDSADLIEIPALIERLRLHHQGANLLLHVLQSSQVVELTQTSARLTRAFRHALRYRDFMRAKLYFCGLAAADWLHGIESFARNPRSFQSQSHTFRAFCYERAIDRVPENYDPVRNWVRITTAYTKYESRAFLAHIPLDTKRNLLDIGGNSGEFALRLCKAYPSLQATVVDLPVVCDIGTAHLQSEPEAGRITFRAANALVDPLPTRHDIVTFKSMLHDWPDEPARALIAAAWAALDPGGQLAIFERGRIEIPTTSAPFSLLPSLMFNHCYRDPAFYISALNHLGATSIMTHAIELESPFFIVSATKAD